MSLQSEIIQRSLLSTAIATAGMSSSAEETDHSVFAIDEIIVTAQKREESLQDAPISISAFSSDTLENIGAFGAKAVGNYTPNLTINYPSGNQNTGNLSMRGVTSGSMLSTADPAVGLYMDGVYLARAAGNAFDIVDLERIEVLRGPQCTLYGRNSIGGAVNLISEKPKGEFAFKQMLSAGNLDYFRSYTSIDVPQVGDFSAKLSYLYSERGGLIDDVYSAKELGDKEAEAFRFALRWTPTDNIIADYVYDSSEDQSNSGLSQLGFVRPGHVAAGGPLYVQAAAAASQGRLSAVPKGDTRNNSGSEVSGHALTVAWEYEDITFKSISAYRDSESKYPIVTAQFPSDGVNVLDGMGGVVPAGELVSLFTGIDTASQDQFSQEFQALGDTLDGRLSYTVGLYYFEESTKEGFPSAAAMPAAFAYGLLDPATQSFLCQGACFGKTAVLSIPDHRFGGDVASYAAYGQFTYAVTDRLDVTLGLRWTRDEREAFVSHSLISLNEGLDIVKGSNEWTSFNPSFNLNFQVNEDISTYASVSSGYHSGGFNGLATSSAGFLPPYDEETLTSFEVGLKSMWFNDRLRLNAAWFAYTYDDRQVQQFVAGASTVTNSGKQDASGFELEVTAIPVEGLTVNFNWGYQDVDIKEFIASEVDPVSGFPLGTNADIADIAEANFTAANTGALIVQYEFKPFSFGQLTAQLDATYSDKRVFDPKLYLYDSAGEQTLVNGRLTLSEIPVGQGDLRLSAWGKNLADKEYREWGLDWGALGFTTNTYQEPRTYGLDVVYEY